MLSLQARLFSEHLVAVHVHKCMGRWMDGRTDDNMGMLPLIMKFGVTDLNTRRRRNEENARCMESNILRTASFLHKQLLGHKKTVKNRLVKATPLQPHLISS